jgi:hypothetical protein
MFSSKQIKVNETPLVLPERFIDSFRYAVQDFEAFNKISFNCLLYDASGAYIEARIVTMEGNDYANWGIDDNYVLDFLSAKLGLVLKPMEDPVTVSDPVITSSE